MTPQVTVADVAQQGQQEKEGRAFVGPAHDPGHCFRVDGVGGEEQAGQQAPWAASEQQASQHGKQARHGPVEGHVDKMITPGLQPTHKVVEAEGEGAERAVGLVAATVREQGAPEVVIKDVYPGGLREQVLISLDCTTAKKKKK